MTTKVNELTRDQLIEVLETACRLINQGLEMGKDWGQIPEDEIWTPDSVTEEWENATARNKSSSSMAGLARNSSNTTTGESQ